MWKERREALNLSQEDLARLSGVSPRTIQRHEAGDPPNKGLYMLIDLTLKRIAKKGVRLKTKEN